MTKDYAPPSTTRGRNSSGEKGKGTSKTKGKGSAKKGTTKKSGAHPAPSQQTPQKSKAKLFISLFILICAFAYGLYFLQSIPPTTAPDKQAKPTVPSAQKSTSPEVESPESRFKFYDLLPESKVVAPKVDAYQFKEKNRGEEFYYMVQTGSFKSLSDAERQKATIAFQGLKASITSITNDKGTTWHRVSTGPFHNRSEMNSALDKLVNINIQPLVKKVKKDS